jgi:formylglycine-generating enzyme required for sulfatase activity
MSKRWLICVCVGVLISFPMGAQNFNVPHNVYPPQDEQIPGPSNDNAAVSLCCAQGGQIPVSEATFKSWLAYIQEWRREHLIRMGYDAHEYTRPELQWTQSSFVQPQMMAQERYFYDPKVGRYTVEHFLDDLKNRYGGIDSVLIWPTYPNLGIDDRNQFDLIRDMPGGIEGLREMIDSFHRAGVRVLFAYNPWDRGTEPEPESDWEALAKLMAAIGADGVNADTMPAVPPVFRNASDRTGHPIAFEPEDGANGDTDFAIAWNNLTWGYWKYPFELMISKNKWLETRHMVHVVDRWAKDKTDSLQAAFFNGVGYESWENIFGVWNSLDDRDAETLRRVSAIERAFAQILVSQSWEPHTPMLQYGAFASKFPGERETLWTIVNRNQYRLTGSQITVTHQPGFHYYDVWNGTELQPEVVGATATLNFDLEAQGYGAVLASQQLSAAEVNFISAMHQLSRRPLGNFSREWRFLPQQIVEIAPTNASKVAFEGMISIPETDFIFAVSGTEIEGGNEEGVDVQMPWEDSPRRSHLHTIHVKKFFIDRYPVTNADFKKFLDATHYHPRDDHNFLKDWHEGNYPAGWAKKPVTWVSIEDAREYARWAGKRLPHEWEWQHAAQGADSRLYPWGNSWNSAGAPSAENGRHLTHPADVDANPDGASPFGVMDLVGNVWQWTDEYTDQHTRATVLRGGSYYQPLGSIWYFPQAFQLNRHAKYLMMAPSLDRSGTIGFRCVADGF